MEVESAFVASYDAECADPDELSEQAALCADRLAGAMAASQACLTVSRRPLSKPSQAALAPAPAVAAAREKPTLVKPSTLLVMELRGRDNIAADVPF